MIGLFVISLSLETGQMKSLQTVASVETKKIASYTVGLGFAISDHEAALVRSHMNGLILFERTIGKKQQQKQCS